MIAHTVSAARIALLAREELSGVMRRLTLCAWESKPNEERISHDRLRQPAPAGLGDQDPPKHLVRRWGRPILDNFEPRPQGAGEKWGSHRDALTAGCGVCPPRHDAVRDYI
jgi:hypothetical protein